MRIFVMTMLLLMTLRSVYGFYIAGSLEDVPENIFKGIFNASIAVWAGILLW